MVSFDFHVDCVTALAMNDLNSKFSQLPLSVGATFVPAMSLGRAPNRLSLGVGRESSDAIGDII